MRNSISFTDRQIKDLEDQGFSLDLLSIDERSVYYDKHFICPTCRGTVCAYYCLKSFFLGYHIGFDRGEDTCTEYMHDMYILTEKSVLSTDFLDLDDLLIPEELKQ